MGNDDITAADIAAFLREGALDVLVGLFKVDPGLYAHVGELLSSADIGVRIGAAALVEELAVVDPARRPSAAAALLPLLAAADQVLRGDAAYLLGFAGGEGELAALEAVAAGDGNADVREGAAEAAAAVRSRIP